MAGHLPTGDRELGYRRLIELGIALSAERNHARLLEKILLGAKELTNADGGTLYLVSEDGNELRFMIMRNDTMEIALGGTTGAPIPFAPVQLRAADGTLNYKNVVGGGGLHRRDDQPGRRLQRAGVRFQRAARFRRAHRLPLAVVSDRAVEEPRRRGGRRAAADQRALGGRAHDPVRGRDPAAGRGARQPGGGGARQPDADRRAKEPVPRRAAGVRQRHRRQVALYRRALPPRPRGDQHAGQGGRRGDARPVRRFPPDRGGVVRARSRRRAA